MAEVPGWHPAGTRLKVPQKMRLLLLLLLLFDGIVAQHFTLNNTQRAGEVMDLVDTLQTPSDLTPQAAGQIFGHIGWLLGFALDSEGIADRTDRGILNWMNRTAVKLDNMKEQMGRTTSETVGHVNQLKVAEAKDIVNSTWNQILTYMTTQSATYRTTILEECKAFRPREALQVMDYLTSILIESLKKDIDDNYGSIRTHDVIKQGRKPIYVMAFSIEHFCRAFKQRDFNADFDSEIAHLKLLSGRIDSQLSELDEYAKHRYWDHDSGMNSLVRASIDKGNYWKKSNQDIANDVLRDVDKHYPWYTWSVVAHGSGERPGQYNKHNRAVECHEHTMRHIQHRNTDVYIFCSTGTCGAYDEACKRNIERLSKDSFEKGRGTNDGNPYVLRWECDTKYLDWAERVFLEQTTSPKCWLLVSNKLNPAVSSPPGASHWENDIQVNQSVQTDLGKYRECSDRASFFAPFMPWR